MIALRFWFFIDQLRNGSLGSDMNTIDFFASQKQAEFQSRVWRIIFLFSTAAISVAIGYFAEVLFGFLMTSAGAELPHWSRNLHIKIAGVVFGAFVLVGGVLSVRFAKANFHVLLMLCGAKKFQFSSKDVNEKRFVNVAQEMALASGTRLPSLYVLPRDESINAFTIGFNQESAAIVLTQSALQHLNRSELQGVCAHEFVHILNNDVAINTRFIPYAQTLLLISSAAWILALVSPLAMMPLIMAILILQLSAGSVLICAAIAIASGLTGVFGKLQLRMLRTMHSRSREWLADAAAVQFTREPSGLRGALEKVDRNFTKELLNSKKFREFMHMFFVSGHSSLLGEVFAVHPPIVARIRALGAPNYASPKEKVYFRVEDATDESEAIMQTASSALFRGHWHEGESRNEKISLTRSFQSGDKLSQESLARAKQILFSAERQLGEHLEHYNGVCGVVVGIALRLGGVATDELALKGIALKQENIEIIKDQILPFFSKHSFADCLSFVPLACLKSASWSIAQRHDLLNKVITIFLNDYRLSAKELSFILTLGSVLLESQELLSFGGATESNRYIDVANLVAFVSYAGSSENGEIESKAYQAAMSSLGIPNQNRPQLSGIPPASLLRAVGFIATSKDRTKRALISTLAGVILADKHVSEDEYHVLRAVCYSLNLPVPLRPSVG